jgi:ribosomal protein S12 methylthiotransferase
VPEEVKQERYDRLMSGQQVISLARNQAQVGRTLAVLIEGQGEVELEQAEAPSGAVPGDGAGTISVGRCYRDAPEIDGMVLIEEPLEAGRMVQVRITDAMEYDLVGVVGRSLVSGAK